MNPQRIVVSVHGIRTFGQWQTRLAHLLRDRCPSIRTETYGYGYFSAIAFLFPPLRWLATLHFRKDLIRLLERFPDAQVDLVAHSFGTHLVGFSIRRLNPKYRNRIHTIVLAGSVLRSDFPWAQLIDAGCVQRVVNDCGVDDAVLILSQFLVLFTGMAGRVGFGGTTNDRFINRFFRGGHSHYFVPSDQQDFLEARWLPILEKHDSVVEQVDERGALGAVQGILLTAMQWAEPLKLAIYIGIPSLLVFIFHIQPLAIARATAASESSAYTLLLQATAKQQTLAQATWAKQARLIALLPTTARLKEFNESLKMLDDALRFDFDRSVLNAASRRALDRFVEGYRAAAPNADIVVTAFAGKFCYIEEGDETYLAPDWMPISSCNRSIYEAYAQKLSERIAASVKAYLVSKDLDPNRISTEGRGARESRFPYPAGGHAKTWNLVAAQNNQAVIRLEADATKPRKYQDTPPSIAAALFCPHQGCAHLTSLANDFRSVSAARIQRLHQLITNQQKQIRIQSRKLPD